jgi:hypothetical protein
MSESNKEKTAMQGPPTYDDQGQSGYPAATNADYGLPPPASYDQNAGYYPPYGSGLAATQYQQQQPPTVIVQQAAPPANPSNNSVTGVIILSVVGIFCFWPLGIVALIFAIQANSHYSAGKQSKGQSSAKTAKGLGIAAIVFGAILIAATIVISIIVSVIPAIVIPAAVFG